MIDFENKRILITRKQWEDWVANTRIVDTKIRNELNKEVDRLIGKSKRIKIG